MTDYSKLPERAVVQSEEGTIIHVSASATGDIITPTSGKAVKIVGFFLYTDASITVELNFKTSGDIIAGYKGQGAIGMTLLGMKKPQGSVDEIVEITITGTGNVKGWVCYKEV